MSKKITNINTESYESAINAFENVVVDWYSTECPPCDALAAKYEPLSEIYGDDIKFHKIFRQENRELSEKLDVASSPTVIFYKNGKETGSRLSGGVKRAELLIGLEGLLPVEKATELKNKIQTKTTECDIAILGGGPTGLTSAIYLAQAKLNVIVIDPALPGGQVSTTHQVSNYPGFVDPIQGFMLSHYIGEQARSAGSDFRSAVDVTSIDLKNKEIIVDDIETIKAKKIIIASGSSPRPLGIPGETEYKGNGISYCATCDAKYTQDKEVVVIGGGNSAIEEALFISKFAKKITIIHQFDTLQANKQAQEKALANPKINFLFEHEPREFKKLENGDIEIVFENLKDKTEGTIIVPTVFVFAGMAPNINEIKENFELDQYGYIQVNEDMQTNIPDIYAAGDVRSKKYRQITTSVADGTIAAISITQSLT